ncbi:MAG: rhamnulokinase [Candidatus Omnitrophica bacterium]|nr:rhamnulokinase [Candidatus Omnitrophota bacterium]
METKKFVAIDLGAESGRGILGEFTGDRISIKEIHRFPTHNVRLHSHIYWDVLAIFSEIKKIIAEAKKEGDISGIGVTTWGVDYGLLGANGLLLSNPFHYRDGRTDGMPEEVFNIVPKGKIFEETGIQFMPINTLYQLYATKKEFPYMLDSADKLLFMPDLFNFFLTGCKSAEYTIATTSQMYNSSVEGKPDGPRGGWARDILESLQIPDRFLPEVVAPGTLLGNISGGLKDELGISMDIPVYAVCCHDTASAVVSIPVSEGIWAYLSSGTWSLLGVETENPIINEKSFSRNFTNEGGYGGSIRFLKNIMGLWILQECRRQWEKEGQVLSYEQIAEAASSAQPFLSFIDVNDADFLPPGNMPERICEYCRKKGQKVPEGIPQIARVILESLAMYYRYAVASMEDIIGNRIEDIHVVGGGSQNKLLSQFTASATKKVVIAGPVEATAAGNLLVQAMANNEISDIPQLREVVRKSFPLFIYQPKETSLWDENYEKYKRLLE